MVPMLASYISDIASLAPLAFALVILILAIMFYGPIRRRIERGGVKGKWKGIEVELDHDVEERPAGEAEAPPEELEAARAPRPGESDRTEAPDEVLGDEGVQGAGREDAEPTFLDVIEKLEADDVQGARETFDVVAADEPPDRREAAFAFTRFRWANDAEGMADLVRLAEDPRAFEARNYLGLAYEHAGRSEKALEMYASVIESNASRRAKGSAFTSAARCLEALGRNEEALDTLGRALAEAEDDAEALGYYVAIAAHYRKTEDWLERALALEKALELDPTSQGRGFETGWSYAQADREDMALLHYATALAMKPDDAASLNNSGVAYENLGMPIRAVRSYKRAEGLGNSLAAANLGNRYLNAGFLDDARKVLEEAARLPDPNPNVASHLSRALKGDEDEAEETQKIQDGARAEQRFARRLAEARFTKSGVPSLVGKWRGADGVEFEFSHHDDTFEAIFKDGDGKGKKLTGKIHNKGLMFTVKTENSLMATLGSTPSFDTTGKGFGLVEEGGRILLRFKQNGLAREAKLERAPD